MTDTIKYGGDHPFFSHRLPHEVEPGDEVEVSEEDADYLCKYDYFMRVDYEEEGLEEAEDEENSLIQKFRGDN